MSFSTYYWFE